MVKPPARTVILGRHSHLIYSRGPRSVLLLSLAADSSGLMRRAAKLDRLRDVRSLCYIPTVVGN